MDHKFTIEIIIRNENKETQKEPSQVNSLKIDPKQIKDIIANVLPSILPALVGKNILKEQEEKKE